MEVSMKRQGVYCVLATVAIQFIVGVAYIWSVFQTGIANRVFGGDNAAASLTFSILLATLTIGSVIGGNIASRTSVRLVVFIGGVILSAGFFLASFVTANMPWLLWVTYGLMGGVGMGFTYTTTISCVQKWYPHKKGIMTGLVVASLGMGGVVFTPIVESLVMAFGGQGAGESGTFMVLSAVFLAVCTIGCLFIKNPPDNYTVTTAASSAGTAKEVKSFRAGEMLKTPQFYIITFAMLFACVGGLMMIAFARPIAVARGLVETATIGVMAITIFNSFGRFFWGMVSDKLGRKNTILILLAGGAVLSLFTNTVQGSGIFVLIALIGFFYGGLLSNFPSLTAEAFGPKFLATNYGFVLLGFGAGAIVSSQVAGYYMNIARHQISLMYPAFIIAAGCSVMGIILMLILKAMDRRKA